MKSNSYLNKIKDFRIVDGEFKNDAGEMQKYKIVQLIVVVDGDDEVINLSGASAPKPAVLSLILKSAESQVESGNLFEGN